MKNTAKNYLVDNGFEILSESDGFLSFVAKRNNDFWFIHVAGRNIGFDKKRPVFESFAAKWLAENTQTKNFDIKFAALLVRKHDIELVKLDSGKVAPPKNSNIENAVLHAKAVSVAMTFATRKDYEIIVATPKYDGFDFVCLDDDVLVFVSVLASENEMPEDSLDRRAAEFSAARWLASEDAEDFGDCLIRFDTIGLMVVGGDRAMIRHHINALS